MNVVSICFQPYIDDYTGAEMPVSVSVFLKYFQQLIDLLCFVAKNRSLPLHATIENIAGIGDLRVAKSGKLDGSLG